MKSKAPTACRQVLLLILLQFVVLLGAGNVTLHTAYIEYHIGDLIYYYKMSDPVLSGALPYRDFSFAYPPLSLIPFLVPHLARLFGFSGLFFYAWGFLIESLCLSTGVALLVARITTRWRLPLRSQAAVAIYAALAVIFSGLLPWRYDLFPALLTLLALYCILAGRPIAAGVWLGLATAAKLYPVVLVPVFILYLLALQQRRGAVSLALGSFGAVVLCLMPFVRVPASTLFSFLTFHTRRGLEIESLPAGVLLALHSCGRVQAEIVSNYGAFHLDSPAAPPIIHALPFVFALLMAAVLRYGWLSFQADIAQKGRIAPETLVRCILAALLAFIAANKVFSTSYVIWLLPFIPLLRPREAVQMMVLIALTGAIYPFTFNALVHLRPAALILLNVRNLFLLMLLFQLTRPALNPPRLAFPRLPQWRSAEA